ncbi:MAG TPA: hypothetical protein VF210_09135 [Pseudomonadales bacterium]
MKRVSGSPRRALRRGRLLIVSACALGMLAGCSGSGDIEISPSTVDNSTNNNGGGGNGGGGDVNPCASYQTSSGEVRQGRYDGTNCTYSPTFVDSGNNLKVDLTIPALPDGGAHIFEGSLFVGEAFNSDAELQAAGIAEGGDGPTLTIEAGATLAWQSNDKFMVINRGSQIFAVGTAEAPITFTSASDVNGDLADDPEAVSQWGGLIINGFGVTNTCEYIGSRGEPGFALAAECHAAAEGSAGQDESFYGGDNDDDDSGRLEYVVVKHTGAEVGNGDELNGVTFNAVGRSTVVRNLQTYSTYDDGIEMFGGAVNIENFAAVYVRDDSIDIDEGWIGTIDTALVIQSAADGNHCIEADGLASFDTLEDATIDDFIARGLNSAPAISNLTCIVSPNGADSATHDPGAGWRFREGVAPVISDSLLIASFGADSADSNYCLRIDDASLPLAESGAIELNAVIIACQDRTAGGPLPGGQTVEDWASSQGVVFATVTGSADPTANADTGLQLLEGSPPIFSIDYATMVVDDAAPAGAPAGGSYIGALSLGAENPFARWTFGIFEDNRAQPLWIEP